ncbi:MAG: hypothetical protein M1813_000946 [Trichoglossum hirsutum]|nr:MAG: hypothetical protein M1813_000946 [Trichoglossum hirsutum]
MSSTNTGRYPEEFRLLLLEADKLNPNSPGGIQWHGTNDYGVLISGGQSDQILGPSFSDYHGLELIQYLSGILSRPPFDNWSIHKMSINRDGMKLVAGVVLKKKPNIPKDEVFGI